jgi:hypothetical protein
VDEDNQAPAVPPYLPALAVYAVWHPRSEQGGKLARTIFDELARELGIPVFFRSAPAGPGSQVPLPIPFELAQRSAVFLLADAALVVERGGPWGTYIAALFAASRPGENLYRTVPILLDKTGSKVISGGVDNQGIRLDEQPQELRESYALNRILHELCRLLMPAEETDPAIERGGSAAPVRLFLSHSKADGEARTRELKAYIERRSVFKTFFDANEIAPGHLFFSEIEASLADPRAMLLVLLTDSYSTRPWCRREVLIAKRMGRPVVVVHAVRSGEPRCFPYLGNAPSLRIDRLNEPWDAAICEKVLRLALREVLRQWYLRLHLNDLVRGLLLPADSFTLPRPPELLACLYQPIRTEAAKPGRRLGLYPDPPLGDEELEVLAELRPDIVWLTPTLFLFLAGAAHAS